MLKRPHLVFWCCSILYCLTWAILASVFQNNFRSDVIEEYFLGSQWVLSSGKHPMLCAWYMNLFRILTFESPIAPYLAVQSLVLVMLWGIWRLARLFFRDDPNGEMLALLAVLASANFRYLNIGNLVYNHNTVVSLCWILAILFLYRALTENRLSLWFWTGFWLGTGFQCKYIIAFLVATMLCFMVFNRDARKYWKTPGPYLTTAVAFLIFLPHLIWLVRHDFPTFRYAMVESHKPAEWYGHFVFPLQFLGALFLVLLPSMITLIPLIGWIWQWSPDRDTDRTETEDISHGKTERRFQTVFLGSMVGIPLLLHVLAGAAGRNQPTSYVMACGAYCTLFLVRSLRRKTDPRSLKRTAWLGVLIVVATMTIWSVSVFANSRYGRKPAIVDFPGRRLAVEVESLWREKYGSTPCPFVVSPGSYWLSGNVHTYGAQKIPVHSQGVTLRTTNEEVNRLGGIVLWNPVISPNAEGKVKKRFPRAEPFSELEIPYQAPFSRKFSPERIRIALIPPPEPTASE